MFDVAGLGAGLAANMLRPVPAWLVSRAANCHAADVDDFEFTLGKGSDFIRVFELFENYSVMISSTFIGQSLRLRRIDRPEACRTKPRSTPGLCRASPGAACGWHRR